MYFNSQRTGLILAHQAWDMLVHRDPATFEIKPSLATEWRFAEDNSLDLNIRQGVKFHDGSPLTRRRRGLHPQHGVQSREQGRDAVATTPGSTRPRRPATSPSRIKMKRPTPAALEYLAMVTPIHPKAYREKVGPEGFAAKPVGAGPYKIVKNEQGKEVVFERFEDYWTGSPKGKPAIKTLHVRFVPDLATEVTELLAQQTDWIWNINPDQIASINKMPHLQAVQQESMRIGYLSIDAAGRSGAGNPLTNLKVRQAIWHAINRQEMADKLVQGGSRVPMAPCFPSQFGCDADAAVKYAYDPAKAKALLAEAGFPNGFETEFLTSVQPTSWSGGDPELPSGGRHPHQDQPDAGGAGDPEGVARRGAALSPKLGQLLDQRRLGDLPGDVRQGRQRQLLEAIPSSRSWWPRAAPRPTPRCARRPIRRPSRSMTEKAYWMPLFTYVNAYAFAKGARFQDLSRRAAAVLLREVEVAHA